MSHIKDKKMWWVVNFCRPTVKLDPGNVFAPANVAMAIAVLMIGMFVALALVSNDHTSTAAAALVFFPATSAGRMARLEKHLGRAIGPNLAFFNDPAAGPTAIGVFSDKIEDLQNELIDLAQKMSNIQAKAKAEQNRNLTEEENTAIDNMLVRFDSLQDEVNRRKRMADAAASLTQSGGRISAPTAHSPAPAPSARVQIVPGYATDRDKWGWKSFGEFGRAVKNAMRPGSGMAVDPRLVQNTAPDLAGSGEVNEDGGFAVPPDFRRDIMVKIAGEDSLLGRSDGYTTEGNQITFPTDETAPWAPSGGIQAYWLGEGDKKTQSKPALKSFDVKLHKLAALIPMTDEILDDAAVMSTYLRRKAPDVIGFKVNLAMIRGTGDNQLQPTGILSSNARVAVDRNTDSPAVPVTFADIVNMWTAMYVPCRSNAIWLINQSIESSLLRMAFPGSGTAVPVYLPPGGLSQSPYGTLMGRPVIPTEGCSELGTEGDIILCDLKQYVTAQKTAGLRQDISIHLFFDYDITAFRFVLRVGGKPWWTAPVSALPGSSNSPSTAAQRSCYVTLTDAD